MIATQIDENITTTGLSTEQIEQAARAVLHHEQADPAADISIVLAGDEQLRALNLQFMGIDAPTDVLSFPADLVDPDSGTAYLGDIVISVERAAAQAAAQGHSLAAEILLLVVHGVLHLLGHDHAEPEEKARMWTAQATVILQVTTRLGLDTPHLPPD